MKSKHSRLEQKYKHYHVPAEGWQLDQDEAKELERRQQVLQGLSELNRSDPGGARAIPGIVFHNISPSRRRQLAEEYPARNSQGASVGHLDYVGAIKEGLNDEEFATLENSFHAYINLPAELQQKWQGDLWSSKPDSDEYKSRKEYERVYATWTAEGLCSLNKLAEEARAQSQSDPDHKPKKSPEPAPKPVSAPEPAKPASEEPEPSSLDPEPEPEPAEPEPSSLDPEPEPEPAEPEPSSLDPEPEPEPAEPEPRFEPEPSAGGEGKGQSGTTGEKEPEDDRQRLLRELYELGRDDPDNITRIPNLVLGSMDTHRWAQMFVKYPAQDSQGVMGLYCDLDGIVKEGLNDEEFATLESSLHAYTSLSAELQQKWQEKLQVSQPHKYDYKSIEEYNRAHSTWTAEGLYSLKKLAEEAQSQSDPDHEPKKSPEPAPEPVSAPEPADPEPVPEPAEPEPVSAPEPADPASEPEPSAIEPEPVP